MKLKLSLSILGLLALTGCATQQTDATAVAPLTTTQAPVEPPVNDELQKTQQLLLAYQNNERALHQEMSSWAKHQLVVVMLDKDKKPQGSKSIMFDIMKDSYPYGKNAVKINISPFNTERTQGRVIQLSCNNVDIKQKFDTAWFIKGWAVEMSCNKTNYFVMINRND